MLDLPEKLVIVDFINDVIDNIRDTYTISSIDDLTGTARVNTSDTMSVVNGDYVTIGGVSYEISSLVADTSFIVTGLPTGGSWKADAPYYYYGTPSKVSAVRSNDSNANRLIKSPYIALLEPFDCDVNLKSEDVVYKTPVLWLLFMKSVNTADYTTPEHYTNAINVMTDLVRDFMLELEKNQRVGELSGYIEVNHANYGLVSKFIGHTVKLFNENISGVEIKDFSLPINKTYACSR